jgi:hypothetical protein
MATLASPQAGGHDLRGLMSERNATDPAVQSKIDDAQELRRLLAKRAAARKAGDKEDRQLEAVIRQQLKWPHSPVKVCFFDGGSAARDRVASLAVKWTVGTSLQFDFGPAGSRRTCDQANPSNIRISFKGVGYWAHVGTNATYLAVNTPTMGLGGLDKTDMTEQDEGIVVHEFGHAIGFEHEHQSPKAKCEEQFDWPYIYKEYAAFGWKKDDVDFNMKRITEPMRRDGLLATEFDRSSVMLYFHEPEYFLNGEKSDCYVPRKNSSPSATDLEAARLMYPPRK